MGTSTRHIAKAGSFKQAEDEYLSTEEKLLGIRKPKKITLKEFLPRYRTYFAIEEVSKMGDRWYPGSNYLVAP